MTGCSPTSPPCTPGATRTSYFYVQPAPGQNLILVREVFTVTDAACNGTYQYYLGATSTPYTGPLQPRVAEPQVVRLWGDSSSQTRNQQSFIASYNVGSSGTGATITFPEAAQGFTVFNPSANWIRVRVQFSPSVATSIPPASRVLLLPPQASQAVDYGANNSDGLVPSVPEPVEGVAVDVVDPSSLGTGVIVNAASLPIVSAVPTQTRVVINLSSA